MFAHERHIAISELIERKQRITVGALQKALRISSATLRRDLAEMEKDGKVVRVHGGVVHPQSLRAEPSFMRKSHESMEAKRAIAQAACDLVPDGASVLLDSGTTCLEIGRQLLDRGGLTLITNSVPLLHEASITGMPILATGGELRALSGALTGMVALEWLEHLQADWAFLGASGIDDCAIATTELSEAAIKRQFLRRARHCVLAADGTKWNATAPVRFAEWRDIECWLTSDALSKEDAKPLERAGLKIVRCKS